MFFKKDTIKVPISKQAPLTDKCRVLCRFPNGQAVDIPATYYCYAVLQRAYNTAYNFTELKECKPLGWFINECLKKDGLAIDKLVIVTNILLKDFLESDYRVTPAYFFKTKINRLFEDLMLLAIYCVLGTDEGQNIMAITAPKSGYASSARKPISKSGDLLAREFLVMDWLHIPKFEYFALTKLNISGSQFWNLTADRMFALIACFNQEQREQEQQAKSDVPPLSTSEAEDLKDFLLNTPNNHLKMH